MAAVSEKPITLSQTSDFLGALATTLRGLIGPSSILNELTQNADDAVSDSGHATKIRFTVTADHLEVWNDGEFSDCGWQRENECPYKLEGQAACDLHAFRLFAGRNKSRDSGKTGAFGVGFTSVYQITDHPELLTGDWHWVLHAAAAENERIKVCNNLSCGRDHRASGTTFVLPWAREQTRLRSGLGVPPVSAGSIEDLERVLQEPGDALLFLHRVRTIESITPSFHRTFTRERGDLGPVISDGESRSSWLLLSTEVGPGADQIIRESRGLIEADRDRAVSVALRLDEAASRGVLFASLPTQSTSGFQGHINASFFPKTDRKGVRFDSDPESAWNRLAVRTAARALAENAELVLHSVGSQRFWELLVEIEKLRQQVQKREVDTSFSSLWTEIASAARSLPSVLTVSGASVSPSEALLPPSTDFYEDGAVLESLGLHIISEGLHPLVFQTSRTELGVTTLSAKHVVDQLLSRDIVEPFRTGDGPLTDEDVSAILRTLGRLGATTQLDRVAGIADAAIIPCRDRWVAPAAQTFVADDQEVELFELLDPALRVVDQRRLADLPPVLGSICSPLTLDHAAGLLEALEPQDIQSFAGEIIAWLDGRSGQLTEAVSAKFAALPIYPSADGSFHPLSDLSLRSGFEDPLEIADLVDGEVVQGHTDLLKTLGAKELDVVEYLQRHAVPLAMQGELPHNKARGLLEVIAGSRARIDAAHVDLRVVAIVPCEDTSLQRPIDVYFPSREIRLIAPEEPIADTAGLAPFVLDALPWLGVACAPRDETLAAAATRLAGAETVPDAEAADALLRALQDRRSDEVVVPGTLRAVVDCAWLPIKGGGTGRPRDVLPTNANYLFGRQGRELGLNSQVQVDCFQTLVWLGMPRTPPTSAIAAHLRDSADHGRPVNSEVYTRLSQAADTPDVAALRTIECVQLTEPGTYAKPSAVFWQETGFGRWVHQLSPERRSQQAFFDAVGVKETPGPLEVEQILVAISTEVGSDRLGQSDLNVVHACWAAFSDALDEPGTAGVLASLGKKRVVPNARGLLSLPESVYFRDAQGVADRFRLLTHDVIRRERATWRALEEAGVRRAEKLFTTEPYNLVATTDAQLPSLLSERREALQRVVEGKVSFEGDELDLSDWTTLDVAVTDDLQVQYRASIGSQVDVLDPVSVDAIYISEGHRLIYRRNGRRRDVARELAHALDPSGETSSLAMAIEHVLMAASLDDAHETLSAYGIADVTDVERDVEMSETIQESDDLEYQDFVAEEREASDASGSADEANSEIPDGGDARTDVRASGDPAVESGERQAGGSENDFDAEGGSRKRSGGEAQGEGRTKDRKLKGPRARARQERLRSYVFIGDDGDRGTRGDEEPDRSPTDIAGVARVLAYEASAGRTATEMAHSNPGYDVQSKDKSGQLKRIIEVKSTSAEWGVMGVMLSKTQFDKALAEGDRYWLYVVEHAEDDEKARIYRIQNPAHRVSYFGFDGGWKEVAEPDIERDERGTPTAPNTRSLLNQSPGPASS